MHSAEPPSERERDRYSRIRLFFDGVAQCPLKGTGGLGGAVGRSWGDIKTCGLARGLQRNESQCKSSTTGRLGYLSGFNSRTVAFLPHC